jgi:hypothetical protein
MEDESGVHGNTAVAPTVDQGVIVSPIEAGQPSLHPEGFKLTLNSSV